MKLLIFTQKIDINDSILGFFHSWILELSRHFETVEVICLQKGEFSFPNNVNVYSLGKESGMSKLKYIKNLFKYLKLLNGKYDRVFVHMNPIYIVLCGWYWKLKNIKIYLWYTHRQVDLKLHFSLFWVTNVFSATRESMMIATPKAVYVGHGIDVDKFPNSSHIHSAGNLRIAHIGRITRIKKIEVVINALSGLKNNDWSPTLFIFGGPVTEEDEVYKSELLKLIEEKGLKENIIFRGWVKQSDIANTFRDINISVNMAPTGGMDKSVLETIILGIPTFISNTAFRDLLGEYNKIFLFEDGNSSNLALKICDFIKSSDNRHALSGLDVKIRRDFSVEALIGRILTYIKR